MRPCGTCDGASHVRSMASGGSVRPGRRLGGICDVIFTWRERGREETSCGWDVEDEAILVQKHIESVSSGIF